MNPEEIAAIYMEAFPDIRLKPKFLFLISQAIKIIGFAKVKKIMSRACMTAATAEEAFSQFQGLCGKEINRKSLRERERRVGEPRTLPEFLEALGFPPGFPMPPDGQVVILGMGRFLPPGGFSEGPDVPVEWKLTQEDQEFLAKYGIKDTPNAKNS